MPAGFRSWPEYEDQAASIRVWSAGILHGLGQTADYARAVLSASPGVTDDIVTGRLTARMERQHRMIMRDEPPVAWFVVDELSLYRRVGSPETMAGQLRRLAGIAAMPKVTVTVMPAVVHPGSESGFIIADEQTVTALAERFDSLRAESYRASESLRMIERLGELWAAGASLLTAGPTAETA